MTPDDAAGEVARELQLPKPVLVRAGMNHTFRAGDQALRVSTSEFQTLLHEVSSALCEAGVRHAAPTGPVIRFPEVEVTTWEWLEPAAPAIDFRALGTSIRALHDMARSAFAPLEPLASCTEFAHLDLEPALASISDNLDASARSALDAELEAISSWRLVVEGHEQVVCHGDVHWNNVIAPATIIDWDLLCAAPRCWDHAALISGTRRWGLPADAYDNFAAGYGEDLRGDDLAELLVRLRDLAATVMVGIRAQLVPDAATEFERRLQSWRGDPAAPTWTAI